MRVRELCRVVLVASDPDRDREIRQQALYITLDAGGEAQSLLREIFRGFVGGPQEEDDVVRSRSEQEVREQLAGLQAHRVGQTPFQLLDRRLLELPPTEVPGEVVYVHDDREGA